MFTHISRSNTPVGPICGAAIPVLGTSAKVSGRSMETVRAGRTAGPGAGTEGRGGATVRTAEQVALPDGFSAVTEKRPASSSNTSGMVSLYVSPSMDTW